MPVLKSGAIGGMPEQPFGESRKPFKANPKHIRRKVNVARAQKIQITPATCGGSEKTSDIPFEKYPFSRANARSNNGDTLL